MHSTARLDTRTYNFGLAVIWAGCIGLVVGLAVGTPIRDRAAAPAIAATADPEPPTWLLGLETPDVAP